MFKIWCSHQKYRSKFLHSVSIWQENLKLFFSKNYAYKQAMENLSLVRGRGEGFLREISTMIKAQIVLGQFSAYEIKGVTLNNDTWIQSTTSFSNIWQWRYLACIVKCLQLGLLHCIPSSKYLSCWVCWKFIPCQSSYIIENHTFTLVIWNFT